MTAKRKKKKKKTQGTGAGVQPSPKKPGLSIYVPAFCSLIGTLMLLTVILAAIPLTVPQYMGYDIYNVVSGSMEPAIPIGSVIYVRESDPVDIKKGDIIAFQSGDSVVMHRVVDNKIVEGVFTTKGDANPVEDINEVPYADLVGIVVRHIPVLGQLLILFASTFGRICMICFAACGALLNILSGKFQDGLKYEAAEEQLRELQLEEAMRAQKETEQAAAAAQTQPGPEGAGEALDKGQAAEADKEKQAAEP